MNREIKFRAWDGKKMLKNIGVMPTKPFRDFDKLVTRDDVYLHPEKWDIMQYTGLKDKNGKEIIESDFVSIGGLIYEVKYQASYFYLESKDKNVPDITGDWNNEVNEVIGNIYEYERGN